MKIEVIDTGYFYADGGAMFGAIPKSAWQRRYVCNEQNRCVLTIRSLLVTMDNGKIILIDTGVGDKQAEELSWYGFFDRKDLVEELLKRGVTLDRVTDVILTHLHFDHCGNFSFPNATWWVSCRQWETLLQPHPLEAASFFKDDLLHLEKENKLKFVEADMTFNSQIDLNLFDGHTPGQIVPFITTPEQNYVYPGDVIPLAAHLSPDWISAYDLYPSCSFYEKQRLLGDVVKNNAAVIYCHDAYTTCTTVKKIHSYFRPGVRMML